jgi:hypothetical protein
MDNYQKYLKYKQKYLKYKQLQMVGGGNSYYITDQIPNENYYIMCDGTPFDDSNTRDYIYYRVPKKSSAITVITAKELKTNEIEYDKISDEEKLQIIRCDMTKSPVDYYSEKNKKPVTIKQPIQPMTDKLSGTLTQQVSSVLTIHDTAPEIKKFDTLDDFEIELNKYMKKDKDEDQHDIKQFPTKIYNISHKKHNIIYSSYVFNDISQVLNIFTLKLETDNFKISLQNIYSPDKVISDPLGYLKGKRLIDDVIGMIDAEKSMFLIIDDDNTDIITDIIYLLICMAAYIGKNKHGKSSIIINVDQLNKFDHTKLTKIKLIDKHGKSSIIINVDQLNKFDHTKLTKIKLNYKYVQFTIDDILNSCVTDKWTGIDWT